MTLDFSHFNPAWFLTFGEAITYKAAGTGTRAITAVVDRRPREAITEMAQTMRPLFHVYVGDSAVTGIAGTELDAGADTLLFPRRPGMVAETFRIERVLNCDGGMLQIEVR